MTLKSRLLWGNLWGCNSGEFPFLDARHILFPFRRRQCSVWSGRDIKHDVINIYSQITTVEYTRAVTHNEYNRARKRHICVLSTGVAAIKYGAWEKDLNDLYFGCSVNEITHLIVLRCMLSWTYSEMAMGKLWDPLGRWLALPLTWPNARTKGLGSQAWCLDRHRPLGHPDREQFWRRP